MLQLNLDDIEPACVTRMEKKRLLYIFLKKKKRQPLRYAIAAIFLSTGIGSSVMFISPTITSQIPVVQNIVDYF